MNFQNLRAEMGECFSNIRSQISTHKLQIVKNKQWIWNVPLRTVNNVPDETFIPVATVTDFRWIGNWPLDAFFWHKKNILQPTMLKRIKQSIPPKSCILWWWLTSHWALLVTELNFNHNSMNWLYQTLNMKHDLVIESLKIWFRYKLLKWIKRSNPKSL